MTETNQTSDPAAVIASALALLALACADAASARRYHAPAPPAVTAPNYKESHCQLPGRGWLEGRQPAGRDDPRQLVGDFQRARAERARRSAQHQQPEHQGVLRELHGGPRRDCRGARAVLADDHREPFVEPVAELPATCATPRRPTRANVYALVRPDRCLLDARFLGQDPQRGATRRNTRRRSAPPISNWRS